MDQPIDIGIIGDYRSGLRSHAATEAALGHAAAALALTLNVSWVATESVTEESVDHTLRPFHALLGAPGSPYRSMEGALRAIRFARERGWPFLGT